MAKAGEERQCFDDYDCADEQQPLKRGSADGETSFALGNATQFLGGHVTGQCHDSGIIMRNRPSSMSAASVLLHMAVARWSGEPGEGLEPLLSRRPGGIGVEHFTESVRAGVVCPPPCPSRAMTGPAR